MPRADNRPILRLALLTVCALSAVVASVAVADADPGDFQVTIERGLPQPGVGLPSCSPPDAGGTMTCTVSGSVAGVAAALTGTATQLSTGRSGTLDASCDWSGSYSAAADVDAELRTTITALTGSVAQSCAWRVTVGTSSLFGTMSGTGTLGVGGPTTVAYDGTLTVTVAAGTGEFAGVVGGGTFEHRQDVVLPVPSPLRATSAAADQPSPLLLTLAKGAPRALIAAPGRTLDAATDSGLRVVSAPRSTCSAIARKAARSVPLGHASDGSGHGIVVIASRLRPKLGPGTWSLAVTCTYPNGGGTGRATARTTVTVI